MALTEFLGESNLSQVNGNAGAGSESTFVSTGLLRQLLNEVRVYVNVDAFGAKGDGLNDDTKAVRDAILSLPASGGTVLFSGKGKKYRLTGNISDAINQKDLVILKGYNDRTYVGNTGHTPVETTVYLKELTTYLFTKSGTGNRVFIIDGIFFDGANGGGFAGSGTTCPGIVYSADLQMNYFTMRKCMVLFFGFTHTNVTAFRALVDITPGVWMRIEKNYFGQNASGRVLYLGLSSTTVKIIDCEFTQCRECYYVFQAQGISFETCVFESCVFIGAHYRSQVMHINCWYENIGAQTGAVGPFTTGIAQRNHGLSMPAGALQAAGGIITPFQQLYGDLRIYRGTFTSFASGGSNYVAPAWFESVGQGTATATGGTLLITGKKPGATQLFYSTTMDMTAAERGATFNVFTPEDGWSTDAGSVGGGLFAGSGLKDYRRVNSGVGRIWMNDGSTTYLMTIKGGRLTLDAESYTSALGTAPGATIYPQGDQWEIGDRIVFPVPVAGGNTGLVCTTAGTATPTWKTYGAIQA